MCRSHVVLIFFLFLRKYLAEDFRLNVPHVLLPLSPTTFSTFDIFVVNPQGRCYNWSLSKQNVVKMEITDSPDCPHSVRITTYFQSDTSVSTLVIAREIGTASSLTCYVTISQIHTISIVSTTKELEVFGLPEIFEVQAFDISGNIFSSLAGLEFLWRFNPPNILNFVKQDKSPEELDGKNEYTVLIRGREAGVSEVSAKLVNPLYREVNEGKTQVIVLNRLMVYPGGDLYVIKDSEVEYEAHLVQQSQIKLIQFPSARYSFVVVSADPPNACQFISNSSTVLAQELGSCKIMVVDSNLKELGTTSLNEHLCTSNLFIVDPFSLEFLIDQPNWLLVVGEEYELSILIHDSKGNHIYPTKNVLIDVYFSPNYFQVLNSSKNGMNWRIKPVSIGNVRLEAHLSEISTSLNYSIAVVQDVSLFNRLEVTPNRITFGYYENQCDLNIPLLITGGTGSFEWSSTSKLVVFNSMNSTLSRVICPGSTKITATDMSITYNKCSVEITVVPLHGVEFDTGLREAFVGDLLTISGGLFGINNESQIVKLDYSCVTENHFSVEDGAVFQIESVHGGNGFVIVLRSKSEGITRLIVTIGNVTAFLKVATYRRLKIFGKPNLLLAPHSEMNLFLTGGPINWSELTGSFNSHTNSTGRLLQLNNIDRSTWSLELGCNHAGKKTVRVFLSNLPSSEIPFPLNDSLTVTYDCEDPTHLNVFTDDPVPMKCRDRHSIYVLADSSTVMRIVATNLKGQVFDSFSLSSVRYQLQDNTTATVSPLDDTRFLFSSTSPGDVRIRVECIISNLLETSVNVKVVEPFRLGYSELFFDMSLAKATVIPYIGGSGVYDVNNGNKSVLSVTFHNGSFTLNLMENGMSVVRFYDECLNTTDFLKVYVGHVGKIFLKGDTHVEIDMIIYVTIKLYNKHGKRINFQMFSGLKERIKAIVSSERSIKVEDVSVKDGVITVGVMGVQLGQSSLYFVIDNLASNSVVINVYPPLKVDPRNITMLAGSYFQLVVKGGPLNSGEFSFFSADTSVVSVKPNGLLTAHRKGFVFVSVQWTDELSSLIRPEQKVIVNVIELSCVGVHASSLVVHVGSRMRLSMIGCSEDINPLIFGSTVSPLTFAWTVNERPLIDCRPLYRCYRLFSVEFTPSVDDLYSISVNVTTDVPGQFASSYLVSRSVIIRAIKPFNLSKPPICCQSLLISPQSSLRLVTSRNQVSLRGIGLGGRRLLDVTSGEWITSGAELGSEFVSIEDSSTGETIGLDVKIENPHYIMANLITEDVNVSNIVVMSTRDRFRFDVTFHSSYGKTFNAVNSSVSYRMNRYDLANIRTIGDFVLEVEALRPGFVTIHIINDRGLSDYILITVVQNSEKTGDFVLGEIIRPAFTPSQFIESNVFKLLSADQNLYLAANLTNNGYLSYRESDGTLYHDEFEVHMPTLQLQHAGPQLAMTNEVTKISLLMTLNTSRDFPRNSGYIAGNEYISCQLEFPDHVSRSVRSRFAIKTFFNLLDWNYRCYVTLEGGEGLNKFSDFKFTIVGTVNGSFRDSVDVRFMKTPNIVPKSLSVVPSRPGVIKITANSVIIGDLRYEVSSPGVSVSVDYPDPSTVIYTVECEDNVSWGVYELYLFSDVIEWTDTVTVKVTGRSFKQILGDSDLIKSFYTLFVVVLGGLSVWVLYFSFKHQRFFWNGRPTVWKGRDTSYLNRSTPSQRAMLESSSFGEIRNRPHHLWSVRED